MVDPAALGPFRRKRPGLRQALAKNRFGLLGQQEPAEPARRIGESGRDGMMAIKPDGPMRRGGAVPVLFAAILAAII
jgi:hypothetical protein